MSIFESTMRACMKAKSTKLKEGNPVSHDLPPSIDSFLQDVAQTTGHISYNDIAKFAESKFTDDDLKSLRKLRRAFFNVDPWDDDTFNEIGKKVAMIVKKKEKSRHIVYSEPDFVETDDIPDEVSRVSDVDLGDLFRINEGVIDIELSDYFNSHIEQSGVYESDEFPAFPDGSPALVYDGEEWQVSAGASWDNDNVIEIVAMTYDAIDSGDVIEGENLLSKTFSVNDKDAAVEYFNKLLHLSSM